MEPTKEKSKNTYTVISLFAGCGGSSLGYRMAGFKELLAIENDEYIASIFSMNFPDVPIWKKDIEMIDPESISKKLNIERKDLDILDGSPPCQGFSMSGIREINDKRNNYHKEYIRFVYGLQPKIFVMENVKGMMLGRYKGIFNEILKELIQTGYIVKCKKMNAKYYQVPQSRERLIFIGTRKDLNAEPSYPEPNTRQVTVKEAFSDIDNKTYPKDIKGYYQGRIWPRIRQGQSGLNGKAFNNARLSWNRVAPTLMKSCSWAGFPGLIHPSENRGITIEEAKALQGFPNEFKLEGEYAKQYGMLGNSVPPLMMKAIAETIKDRILDPIYARQNQ